MSKEVTFDLTIRFSEKVVTDDDFKEIAENICTAIVREAENYGIAPEESDVFVEFVDANHPLSGTRVVKKIH